MVCAAMKRLIATVSHIRGCESSKVPPCKTSCRRRLEPTVKYRGMEQSPQDPASQTEHSGLSSSFSVWWGTPGSLKGEFASGDVGSKTMQSGEVPVHQKSLSLFETSTSQVEESPEFVSSSGVSSQGNYPELKEHSPGSMECFLDLLNTIVNNLLICCGSEQ